MLCPNKLKKKSEIKHLFTFITYVILPSTLAAQLDSPLPKEEGT